MVDNSKINLGIIIIATKRYQFALKTQARYIKENLMAAGIGKFHLILVTCKEPIEDIKANYDEIFGKDGYVLHHIIVDADDSPKTYSKDSNLLIARLYSKGFDKARLLNLDYLYSCESDCLPNANVLRCLINILDFDDGFYDVAFSPYISQGGGGLLGGAGDEQNFIFPNFYPDELDIPKRYLDAKTRWEEDLNKSKSKLDADKIIKKLRWVNERMKKYPPRKNTFGLNAENFRNRGWFENQFCGLSGLGTCVQSTWMGLGSNLFSKKSLQYLDMLGYQGDSTADLWMWHKRLAANGLRCAVVPHALTNHVIRRGDSYKVMMLKHQRPGPGIPFDIVGHLRVEELDWNDL